MYQEPRIKIRIDMAKKYIDAELIKSTRALYFDIDTCITELIRARTEHNEEIEGKALFRMEGLMVVTMQQLDCIIDSLQQEQPSEDLEEAADEYSRGLDYYHYTGDDPAIAFIAGAEWQAERLLKGSPMPEDTVIFQKGIEEGKRLMMEDAVEGYVNYYEDSCGKLMAEAQVGCPYHNGDKVKIIIVKEDKK